MGEINEIRISQWIDKLQSQGKFSFSLDLLGKELPKYSTIAIKRALSRLTTNGKIISVYKGYYLIIPPQYASKGILPPALFIDAYMKNLDRPYYVALLNAAAFHGASHQQPQEYFVITDFPVLRSTKKKGLKINYISKKEIPVEFLESKKTESGYLMISNALLTAVDLIQFEKRVGGINRVVTILNELIDQIKQKDFTDSLIKFASNSALQRLGYIIDKVFENKMLADKLYLKLKNENLFRIPLKASATFRGFPSDNRWKVIVNTKIEIDE
jgi:predicted transcriptional regulator of viral defense system